MSGTKEDRPYRDLATFKTLLLGGAMLLIGLVLLYVAESFPEFWETHKSLQEVAKDLGSLLIVSLALGAIWELIGKRSFAKEVLEVAGMSANVSSTGLRSIGTSWLEDADWAALFNGVRELEIFVAYGQSWRTFNLARLEELARRRNGRIRLYLPDPENASTMEVLSGRFSMTSNQLIERITGTRRDFEAMRVKGGASIDVFYFAGDRVFSLYRFDETAVITLYRHRKERTAAVPTIVCGSGSLYEFALSELKAIRSNSRPAQEASQ